MEKGRSPWLTGIGHWEPYDHCWVHLHAHIKSTTLSHILYYFMLYCILFLIYIYNIKIYYSKLYHIISYYIKLYFGMLYSIISYHIILYYIILYYIILHYIYVYDRLRIYLYIYCTVCVYMSLNYTYLLASKLRPFVRAIAPQISSKNVEGWWGSKPVWSCQSPEQVWVRVFYCVSDSSCH